MRAKRLLRASEFAVLLTFFLLPVAGHATPCTAVVGVTPYPSINVALGAIGNGPGTITVTGTCTENVSINDAQSITIVAPVPSGAAAGGATIFAPQDNDAFDIFRSRSIVLKNLEIIGVPGSVPGNGGGGVIVTQGSQARIISCDIHHNESFGVDADTGSVVVIRDTLIHDNTPNDGLDVFDNTTVDLINDTIQNNGDPVAGTVGIFVARDSVVVFRQTNLVQNNANAGIQARNLSNVILGGRPTIQGHLNNGVILQEGSHLQGAGVAGQGVLIQDNGSACPLDPTCGGVSATQDSTVDLAGGSVSGNHGSGVSVQQGSNVQLRNATVSNNTGAGVNIQWLSIGNFISGNTITGNGGASVSCQGRSLALGNLSTFSKVSCGDN